MSNYLQDSREEIIAIARGHGLPISSVTACNTSSVFAAGIISNSRNGLLSVIHLATSKRLCMWCVYIG